MTANHSSWSSVVLALRSLLWTIVLPGFFAGYDGYTQQVGRWIPRFSSRATLS